MALSAFPYIGGKANYAGWILEHLPEHQTYVEPFGGAASVLLNKPESKIEVYNDRNTDLVHFFQVLRESPDELLEWLQNVPYARDVHERWTREYYDGHRPDDDIERAGRFYFMRFSQFAAKINSRSGFKAAKNSNPASAFSSGRDRIERIADRFGNVIVECMDWQECLEQYDAADTVFYLDPPYVDCEEYYGALDFDHDELCEALADVDGDWLLSYEVLPDGLRSEEYWVVEKDVSWSARATNYDGRKDATERLIMNFDPEQMTEFSTAGQTTLSPATDGGVQ